MCVNGGAGAGGGQVFGMNGGGAGGPGGGSVCGRPTLDVAHVAPHRVRDVCASIDTIAAPIANMPTIARFSAICPQRVNRDFASVAWTPLVASTACVTWTSAASEHNMYASS